MNLIVRISRILMPIVVVTLIPLVAQAQIWTGNGDGVNWFDANNWDTNVVPDSSDDFPSIDNSANVEINQALDIGQVLTQDATLSINADTTSDSDQAVFASSSTTTVNANIQGIGISGSNSVLNHNSGTVSGSLDVSGTVELNRTGGTLQLNSLNLNGVTDSALDLDAGDSVSGSVSLSNGSELNIDGGNVGGSTSASSGSTITLNSGSIDSVDVSNSTFNWNGGTFGDTLDLSNNAIFNRNASGSLSLENLFISSSDFELAAGDTISNTSVDGPSTLTINGGALTGSSFIGTDSTVDLNSGSISGFNDLFGGVLNLNGGTVLGDLFVTDGQVNRNSTAAINLDSLSLSNTNAVALGAGDSVANSVDVSNGSELSIDGGNVGGSTSASSGSTITLNSGSIDSVDVSNSTFNWNGGTFGDTLDLSNNAIFNRNASGSLSLENLFISSSDFELAAGDTISNTSVDGPSTLTINGGALTGSSFIGTDSTVDLNSGSISGFNDLFGGVLNLNGGTVLGDLFVTDGQVNRNSTAAINLDSLSLSNTNAVALGAGDSVANSVDVSNGSELNIDGALVENLSISNGGVVNFSDGQIAGLSVTNALLGFEGGDITGSVDISAGTVVSRSEGANFDVDFLSASGATTVLDLIAGDQIGDLNLDSGATVDVTAALELDSLFAFDSIVNVVQDLGQTDGLFIEDTFFDRFAIEGSTINLLFDAAAGPNGEFDEAFAVAGNQTSELQFLLDNGQITFSGNSSDVGVFFDAGNNRTSIGFVSAIPEPSSVLLLSTLATGLLIRRRR